MRYVIFALFAINCATPVIVTDTTPQQRRTEIVADRLDSVITAPELNADQKAAVISAQDELRACQETFKVQDKAVAACSKELKDTTTKYEVLRDKTGFLSWLDSLWKMIVYTIVVFLIGTFFGRFIIGVVVDGVRARFFR